MCLFTLFTQIRESDNMVNNSGKGNWVGSEAGTNESSGLVRPHFYLARKRPITSVCVVEFSHGFSRRRACIKHFAFNSVKIHILLPRFTQCITLEHFKLLIKSQWKYPPFEAFKDENGTIWARGTCDMKGATMAQIEAIRRLKQAGHVPLRTTHMTIMPGGQYTFL